jgi:hypothetical protein
MAITTTSQVLYDGPRRAMMQFTGTSDGSGQLNLATLVDASALEQLGPGEPCRRVGIESIKGSVKPQGSVQLFWGALVPNKFADLAGTNINFDYRNITSITAPAGTDGPTGDILISTDGFAEGTTFMLELSLIKKT